MNKTTYSSLPLAQRQDLASDYMGPRNLSSAQFDTKAEQARFVRWLRGQSLPMKPKPINQQTQGPLHVNGRRIEDAQGVIVCEVAGIMPEGLANRPLLAAAYTSYDRAARELGVDAVELAESLDLAALIQDAAKAAALIRAAYLNTNTMQEALGKRLAALLSKLPAKG